MVGKEVEVGLGWLCDKICFGGYKLMFVSYFVVCRVFLYIYVILFSFMVCWREIIDEEIEV